MLCPAGSSSTGFKRFGVCSKGYLARCFTYDTIVQTIMQNILFCRWICLKEAYRMPTIAEVKSLSKVLSKEGCMTLLRWRDVVRPQCSLTLVWSQGRQCQPESAQKGVKMQSSPVRAMFALLVTLTGLLWLGGLMAISIIPWGADCEARAPNSCT